MQTPDKDSLHWETPVEWGNREPALKKTSQPWNAQRLHSRDGKRLYYRKTTKSAQGSCILWHHHFIMFHKTIQFNNFLFAFRDLVSPSQQNNKGFMFYLIWICLFLYLYLYLFNYSYLETNKSPASSTFYNKQGEFLSFYYISEEMPDPGSSLGEKLAGSLLAQIQKEQIKKGWDDWTLLFFRGVSFVLGCTVTLMLSLSFEPCAGPWVPRTKEYDALPEALNGLSIYFLKEWDSPFDSFCLFKSWM